MESLVIKLLPFIKVLSAFALMLLGIRLKAGIGFSILAGGFALAMMFCMPVFQYVEVSALALTQEKFLFLAAIIGLILILSDAMERSGQSQRLMEALSGYLTSPRLRLVFFPALIGLLPMPGGAVFSAPMIKTASADMRVKNSDRAVVNYWFRHVWEAWWPLYPGIIMTVALADITLLEFISKTWPGTIVMIVSGWYFYLRPSVLGTDLMVKPLSTNLSKRAVFKEGLPLFLAIVGAIGFEGGISTFAPNIAFEWGVLAALFAGVVCVMIQNTQLGATFLKDVLFKKSLHSMLFVIIAVFIFKDVMQAAGVVDAMAKAAGGETALFATAIFLPFLVGMVSGITVAFVGSTFPLLIGVLHSLGMQADVVPYMVLALFSGFTGVMISPIHICLILTCQYFGCDLARTWRKLVWPCVIYLLCGVSLFYIWL